MAKRNLYLDTKPVEEAAELYLNALRPVSNDSVRNHSGDRIAEPGDPSRDLREIFLTPF